MTTPLPPMKQHMWDAAPAAHTRVAVAMLAATLWLCSGAAAESAAEHTGAATAAIWAAELTNGQAKGLTFQQVYELRRAGVTAVIIDRSRLDRRSREQAQNIAEIWKLLVIDVSDRAALRLCNSSFARAGQRACALVANSVKQAIALARLPGTHLIIVRVKSAEDVRRLTAVRSRGRFVALGRLGARDGLSLADWQTAVRLARSSGGVHLGAAAGTSAAIVSHYFSALAIGGTVPTASPPTAGPASPTPAVPAAKPPVSGDSGVAKLPTKSGSAPPTPVPVPGPSAAPLPASGNSGVANLFIDSDGGTCTRSGSRVVYNSAAACASFDAAYDAASCSDLIYVKAGSYGTQALSGMNSCTSSTRKRIVEVPGETATLLGALDIGLGRNVHVQHLSVEGIDGTGFTVRGDSTTDILLRSIRFIGGASFISGSDHITLDGVEIDPADANDALQVAFSGTSAAPDLATNITINNSYFHGVTHVGQGHEDCLQTRGSIELTVTNSTFNDCGTASLIIAEEGGPLTNIVIRNNLIGGGTYVSNFLRIGSPHNTCTNIDIQYNTVIGGGGFPTCGTMAGTNIVRGNYAYAAAFSGCRANTTYENNVWYHPKSPLTCNASDKQVMTPPLGFSTTSPGWSR